MKICRTIAFALSLTFALTSVHAARADLLTVPGDFSTIQAAIDAAPNGAVIFVAAGVYVENLDFLGKAIVVEGAGPDSVIDGGAVASVVRFVSGEGPSSVLDSFTITGGFAATGGGIEIRDSSPTILRNVVVGNTASSVGSGIYIGGASSAPQIYNNLMMFNTGTAGGDPHTVQVSNASPRLINNTIVRNDSNAILTSGSGVTEIRNNILARNGTEFPGGGTKGRGICDFAPNTITQYNLFYRNVRSALLTAGTDFRRIREAERVLANPRLAFNNDRAPRFGGGPLPRTIDAATIDRFVPAEDSLKRSGSLHTGDPDPAYRNTDQSRNTMGFTGGPFAMVH